MLPFGADLISVGCFIAATIGLSIIKLPIPGTAQIAETH
jgi:hypothetical protein